MNLHDLIERTKQSSTPNYWWVEIGPYLRYRVFLEVDWVQMPGTVLDTCCTRFDWNGRRWVVGNHCQEWQHELDRLTEALDQGYSPFRAGIKQVDGSSVCQHVEAVLCTVDILPMPSPYEWALKPPSSPVTISEMEPAYV